MITSIYLLPHQDDESFVLPKIIFDVREKDEIFFFFLTENKSPAQAQVRRKESERMLNLLGIDRQHVFFLGSELRIFDGELHFSLKKVYSYLESFLLKRDFFSVEVVCPAYEGGHQDHDAAFIVAYALCKQKKIDKVYEFFMYHGLRTRGKFYEVAQAASSGQHFFIKYTWSLRRILCMVPWIYQSQYKTMLGLWPFLFFKALFRHLDLRVSDSDAIQIPSFGNVPMYERWGRVSFEIFDQHTQEFIENF